MIHERFPRTRETLPRVAICDLPTPVRAAPGLGEGVWLKDDALSADPWGGNKPRKLEWLLADAKARRFGTVVTFGGLGTNHGLATAIYARREGLDCVLALADQPRDEHVERQLARLEAAASRVYLTGSTRRTMLSVPYLALRCAQARPPRPPYLVPPGGSSPLGAVGFVEAALELAAQVEAGHLPEPRAIVVALGSGGSAAGLAAGLAIAGLRTRVAAVLVNDQLDLTERSVTKLAKRTLRLLAERGADTGAVEPNEVRVVEGHMGAGYGHPTPEAGEAIRLAAEAEQLGLDPVYTGKALAALLAGAAGDGPLLFWNTNNGRPYA
ncbi:MAG: D-cysteine desulfhydrase [Thermoleophilaceae bacterium]|nr:D-cysteine desulfhydrase [Thermoleophilaceae bacterium]